VKSMTGYGSATGRIKKGRLFCEIKTINHRYCEISLRIPNRMSALESKIRDHLKGRVERGKIDIFMKELDPVWGGTTLMADVPLARQYQRVLGVLQKSLHLNTSANLLELIGAGTFIHSQEVEGNYEKIWSDVRRLFDQALKQVETMRRREGAHLLADQKMRVKLLKKILAEVEKLSKNNWTRKQQNFTATSEAPLLENKSDITEELTRLVSHLQQYDGLLKTPEAIGRKLDFFIQEMHREINTIGAKACDAVISGHIVSCKAELEKLREQVQNVE